MVKVSDKGGEKMSHGNGPSSMDSDGSFVVLERSTTQGNHSLQFPNSPQMQSLSSVPPTSFSNQTRDNPMSSYLTNSIPSLSPEEIQRKLQEVLQENVELKETLHQNNLAMKQQFNTLVMWQEEVFKVHQSHKEKFQETKELILKLKAENTELKKYLEKCGNSSDIQLQEENAILKGQVAELQQRLSAPMPRRDHPHGAPTKKEEELTELVKQLNTQLESSQRSRRQLELQVESLTAVRMKMEREHTELKAAIQGYNRKCAELQQTNAKLEEKVQKFEHDMPSMVLVEKVESNDDGIVSHQMQAKNLELEKAGAQIIQLKSELENEKENKSRLLIQMQQQEAVLQDLQKKLQVQSAQKQLPTDTGKVNESVLSLPKTCEGQLKNLNEILLKQTDRYLNLNKWLENAATSVRQWQPSMYSSEAQSIAALRTQIEQLMKLLAKEQAYSAEMKMLIGENESRFQELFDDYQKLLMDWESFHQDENVKAKHNTEYHNIQAKGFTEKLDHLMAQVLCKDEELKENEKEIKELREKVKKLELENEAIGILKAQVEVYQSDFNAEREARQNLAGEKERLAEDLRHLQRRNQQMLDEMESYQRAQFEHIQNRSNDTTSGWNTIATPGRGSLSPNILGTGSAQNSSSTSDVRQRRPSPEVEPSPPRIYDEDVPPPKEYVCPLCKMAFKQLELLEYHIETCLDS